MNQDMPDHEPTGNDEDDYGPAFDEGNGEEWNDHEGD